MNKQNVAKQKSPEMNNGYQTSSDSDIYTAYKNGLHRLIEQINRNDPAYSEALTHKHKLFENVADMRLNGDNERLRYERSKILNQLNRLALSVVNQPFLDWCQPDDLIDENKHTEKTSDELPIKTDNIKNTDYLIQMAKGIATVMMVIVVISGGMAFFELIPSQESPTPAANVASIATPVPSPLLNLTPIVLGKEKPGTLVEGESDTYRFVSAENAPVTITIKADFEYRLILKEANGQEIKRISSGFDKSARSMPFTPETGTEYIICVEGHGAKSKGGYTISVTTQ